MCAVPSPAMQCSMNVVAGESEDDRMMTTGLHTVRDIFCVACGAILGWKYVCNMNLDIGSALHFHPWLILSLSMVLYVC